MGGIEILIVWIVCGIGAFLLAQNRGATNAATWFLVGILLGPLGILLAAVGAKGPGRDTAPVLGTADELTKLAVLRDAGTITEVEFDRQKVTLLAKPVQASDQGGPSTGVLVLIVVVVLAGGWLVLMVLQQNAANVLSRVGGQI